MSRVDFDALVLTPCLDTFGDAAEYYPQQFPHFSIQGVFDRAYTAVAIKDGVPVTETLPVLGVRAVQFPNPPLQGDTLTIGAETFIVREVRPDGHGHIKLMLNFVSNFPRDL